MKKFIFIAFSSKCDICGSVYECTCGDDNKSPYTGR